MGLRRGPELVVLLKKLETIADEMAEADDVIGGVYGDEDDE